MRKARAISAASAARVVEYMVRMRSERSSYSGIFRSEIGSPPAMRRSANDGILVHVERSRDRASIWTTAEDGVLSRIHAYARCCGTVTTIVQGKPGPMPRL